ncbi:MAG: hypothetical protein ACP5GZ_06470 [Vulcanisaeta sp.]|uniref:hypothetical protein n=1 Tax=Vulcanisaeta sp. TaxID=2020871 RepID=UPI003D0A9BC1
MSLRFTRPWFRARLEETLLIALATPLFLAQPVSRVIDALINEAQRLNFGYSLIRRLLIARAALSMNEPITRYVGGFGNILEVMTNAERLGIEPSMAVLYILRELDDALRRLGNDYRDLVILLDTLTIITLAIMPMTITLISKALSIDPTTYLVITYASASPITALLSWSLDPGLIAIDNKLMRYLGLAIVPAIPIYIVIRSIALTWLVFSIAFLGLSLGWYIGKVRSIIEIRHTAINRVMRAVVTPRLEQAQSGNWLDNFINEYAGAIIITGMGRPDVLNIAVTSLTHVMNTIMDSRRVGYISLVISISFMDAILIITRLVATQVIGGMVIMQLMLPTVILGGLMCGYLLDSLITGIYATVPLVITYIVLTMA